MIKTHNLSEKMSGPEDCSLESIEATASLTHGVHVIPSELHRQWTGSRSTGSKGQATSKAAQRCSGVFSETVFAKAEDSSNHIRRHYIGDKHKTRCSFYGENSPVREDVVEAYKVVAMIESAYQSRPDSICIIEDIDAHWIQTLGPVAHLRIPHEFFVGHLTGCDPEATRSQLFSDKIAKISVALDDLAEETAFAYNRHGHLEHDSTQASYPLPLEPLSFLNNVLPLLKTYIDGLGFSVE
ncbi:hypothetical protein LTR95_014627 [Oleoguttula sp. CCFEE 5521]